MEGLGTCNTEVKTKGWKINLGLRFLENEWQNKLDEEMKDFINNITIV